MEVISEELLHSMAEEASIKHYGVLGMKWGRHKDRNRVSKTGSKTPKESKGRYDKLYNAPKDWIADVDK